MKQYTVNLSGIIDSKTMKDNVFHQKTTLVKWFSLWWRPILAEFISTGFLVLLGCMASSSVTESNNSGIYHPLGVGFIVLLNIQIFGHISGALMNPSVSLAAVLYGRIPIHVGICYIVAECLGAIAGYRILMALSPLDLVAGAVCVTRPMESLSSLQSVSIELVLTTAYIFLNCGLWDPINKDKQDSAEIKYGLVVVGLALAGGPLTGASVNPARSLGPAIWTGAWEYLWIYWVGPPLGSVLAVLVYRFILTNRATKDEEELSNIS